MATSCDNRQALYEILQYVLTTTNPPQNTIAVTEEKYHRIVTQQVASGFSLPILTIYIFQRI